MKKRILSVLLVVILVLSLMPITALANTEIITWSDLQNAITSASPDATITLTKNLTAMDDNTSIEIPNGKNITLDLAGFVLNGNGKVGSVITINNNASLTIIDNDTTTEHYFSVDSETGLWTLLDTKEANCKTVKGGVITGGTGITSGSELLGGGVYVASSGVLVMNGGTIAGCSAQKGGGIFTRGNMTMNNDSRIVGCTATVDGGGVCACNCTVTMNGSSKVSDCTADNGAGGVYIFGDSNAPASFTMNDNSTISNCEAKATYSENIRSGGGVCVEGNRCTFTMNDGLITKNEADTYGGGVYVYTGTFTMKNGNIVNNTATSNGGGGVHVNKYGNFTMINGNIADNTAKTGGGVNVNGGGNFTMENGNIADNTAKTGGGVCLSETEALFNMHNGKIANNVAEQSGGGVHVGNGAFTMNNGTIANNSAITYYGGGVCVSSKSASFNMSSGKIDGNTAGDNGGGVALMFGNVTLGGDAKITNNVINGTITNGKLTGGTANNVYLNTDKYITLGDGKPASSDGNGVDKPTANFKVGVTTKASPKDEAPVQFTTNGSAKDIDYFFSDNKDYEVQYNTKGYLELIVHEHTIEKVDGQAPTETASGWKDYYECKGRTGACGALFEDENGTTPIEDFDTWKAKGGNGYIAPLVHKPELVNGKKATYTEAGYKSYYVCKNCGKYYEDAKGLVEITDIDKWKAKGGKGYLPKLEKDPDSPQTGDSNNMTLWIILLVLSYTGLFAFLFFEKIKNE